MAGGQNTELFLRHVVNNRFLRLEAKKRADYPGAEASN